MKKLLTLSLMIFLFAPTQHAQEFLPFASSNYAGVTGLQLQPASIADSRYKFDLAISSTSFSINNNMYGIDPYALVSPRKAFADEFDLKPYVFRNFNGEEKSGIISLKQDVFSFMITLSEKDAIAFTPSVRFMLNLDNVSEDLARLIDSGLNYPELWKIKLNNANFSLQLNAWTEFGVTYARVIMDQEKHFLKAGVTAKFTQGIGSAYMFAKDLSYNFANSDTLSLFQSYVSYGTSDNLENEFDYKFDPNPSISFDLGFVYEYRPGWMKYKYDMNGKTNLWRRNQDKYLFRLGVSVSDLGDVRYRRNPMSNDFNADIQDLYIGDMTISSPADLDTIISENFSFYDVPSKFNMNMPAVFSVQADVRVAKGLYFNFTPYIALKRGTKDINKSHYLTSYNFVPRYDLARFGISVPVQYNAYKQWNVGLGLRLGYFWLGSNDIISLLTSSNDRFGTAFSAVVKVPILYKQPKDRDNDKVSNRKDKCPDVPGLFELDGCPDADLDGITDELDKCPDVPGLKEFEGCPDSDGDGIIDGNDKCPDVKGLAQFNGCPDSDGDGIIDQDDACPFNAGSLKMNGCPDQDDDGIADKDDNCPTVAGTRENKGCPFIDTDGDGINDDMDKCPGIKGPVDNQGCPYQDTDNDGIPDKDDDCPSIPGTAVFNGCPDTDGDGISDKYDLCPTIPGVAQNNGCPEIKKEEQEILKKAFDNLEFETGKSVIRSSSSASLDELSTVLEKRPEFMLLISGHTDNVGSAESNLKLSQDRSLSVKNYLIKKGIKPERIKAEWFGQTKPIGDNSTPDGRQLNRRVEMKIIFE